MHSAGRMLCPHSRFLQTAVTSVGFAVGSALGHHPLAAALRHPLGCRFVTLLISSVTNRGPAILAQRDAKVARLSHLGLQLYTEPTRRRHGSQTMAMRT